MEASAIRNKNVIMLAGSFLLGLLFVYLFYGKAPGVSIPLFIAGFYVLMFYCTRRQITRAARFGWFLMLPIAMLSFPFFLFGNEVLKVLDLLALPVLILLQTLLVTGSNSFSWFSPAALLDIFFGVFYRCFCHVAKPFTVIASLVRGKSERSRINPAVGKVLVGLLISVPLVLLLVGLLSSADMVFGSFVEKIPDFFKYLDLADFTAQAFLTLLVFFLSFSYMWSINNGDKPGSSLTAELGKGVPKVLDPVITLTIMAIVDVVYVSFVAIQFAYLFGGANFALPADFTYSEYARRGFFELIAVTVINICILSFFLGLAKKSGARVETALRILYSLMVCCTFVMLFSAHFRMSLYEEAYGYTYLRMFTHLFMGFLLVLFLITLLRVWSIRVNLPKAYIVTALIAFVIFNYVNVDIIIAQKNINRYEKTGQIDLEYLKGLSNDAIPVISVLEVSKDAAVSKEIKAYLDNKRNELSNGRPWQSFNLADARAEKILVK